MTRRLLECVERWPECSTGAHDPRCCRFPKSCSATVYGDETDESLLETARWEAEKHGFEPMPLPDGPFVWVLTLSHDTTHEMADQVVSRLTAALPKGVRDRSRIVLLAPGWTLHALGDDDLRDLGLQRIGAQ